MKIIFIQSKFATKLLLALVALFIHHAALAQATVHGKVLRSANEPAMNASALLLKANDSLLIKAMVCDKDGAYSFTNITEEITLFPQQWLVLNQLISSVINIDHVT